MPETFMPIRADIQNFFAGIVPATDKTSEQVRITIQAKVIYQSLSGNTFEKEELLVKYLEDLPSNIQAQLKNFRVYCQNQINLKAGI